VISKPDYKLVSKDIRDVSDSDLQGFDVVIHLAALSNDPLGEIDEKLTYEINYKASVKLAQIAKQSGVSQFLFSSSCSLYGNSGGNILDENAPSNPQTPYGKSKILAEEGIRSLADKDFNPTYLRNATAFGYSPKLRFDLVVNNLVGYAHTLNEIKILGDGMPWRPLIHVRDIARAFIATLEAKPDVVFNKAINVGSNSQNYRIIEIAKEVQKFFPSCEITVAHKCLGDTRDYNVSFKKIETEMAFSTKWSLQQGIIELKEIVQKGCLNFDSFSSRRYNRLLQIKYLIETKAVDKTLRRI
jgi:nucleoside-diphosphate-sugar epimerase